MPEKKADICMIRIIFPVESDDQAIEIKKKIAGILGDIEDSQTQFSIMPPTGRRPNVLPME